MNDQLSPAAQAVIDAVVAASPRLQERGIRNTRSPLIAAALRAAVKQVLPDEPRPTPSGVQPGGTRMYYHERMARWEERQDNRRNLLDIAAELEGANG